MLEVANTIQKVLKPYYQCAVGHGHQVGVFQGMCSRQHRLFLLCFDVFCLLFSDRVVVRAGVPVNGYQPPKMELAQSEIMERLCEADVLAASRFLHCWLQTAMRSVGTRIT